jgi:aspartate 1-decarboxylase
VVTDASLNYIGSITIDKDLMDAADIVENEKVTIVNNNNGERFETYVIQGERGSGVICLNGAAARLVQKGDVVIILTYTILEDEECTNHKPRLVFIGENNSIKKVCQGRYE